MPLLWVTRTASPGLIEQAIIFRMLHTMWSEVLRLKFMFLSELRASKSPTFIVECLVWEQFRGRDGWDMQKIGNMFGTILFKMSLLTNLSNLHSMVTEQDRASKWLCSLNLNSQRAKFWSSLASQISWTRFVNYERWFFFPWRQAKILFTVCRSFSE